MYFSHTGTGLAWHLNDVFIREHVEPALAYPLAGEENPHALYATAFTPAEDDGEVVALRVEGSMVSAQGAQAGERPLWGVQVPGSDADPTFVLFVWAPEDEAGRWALHLWRPRDGARAVLPLGEGPLDAPLDMTVARGLDGETFDVFWRGVLLVAGQPLPAPVGPARAALVIGEGAHVWIREVEAEVGQ